MSEFIPPRPPLAQRPKRTKEPFGTRHKPLAKKPSSRHIRQAERRRRNDPPDPNPTGRCMCGCGGLTRVVEETKRPEGLIAGHHRRFIWGHQHRAVADIPDPNPTGECMCGCGGETAIVKTSRRSLGLFRGHHRRYLKGHHTKGTAHGMVCTCDQCGAVFETRSPTEHRRFCSRKCLRAYGSLLTAEQYAALGHMNAARVGALSGSYKHGMTRSKRSAERFQSGQFSCQMCGGTDRLHQHHVIYKQHVKRASGDVWDGDNALALCIGCHPRHHSRGAVVPTTSLRDENIRFAFDLLGAAAFDYFARYYGGDDPRVEQALIDHDLTDQATRKYDGGN